MVKSYFSKDINKTTKEIFAIPKRKFLPIEADFPNEIFQCDLLFYNKNITILSVIDVYSRKAFIQKCSSKTATSILKAFKDVLKKFPVEPKKIYSVQVDDGGEFKGVFKQFLNKNDIDLVIIEGNSTQDTSIHLKQAIVERYNGTMRNLIKRYLDVEDIKIPTQKDFDILNDGYNEHIHSTIQCSPNKAYSMVEKPRRKLYNYNIKNSDINFKIGTKVRLLIQYKKMSKNAKNRKNYSKEIYKIIDREGHTFKITDGTNNYYPYTRLRITK